MTEPATTPPPPPPPAPARACSACGAPQDERQEICVECGHAAEPRERWRLRRALPTASLAAFAVLLAASAAYGLTAGGAHNVSDPGLAESKKPAVPDAVASAAQPPPATTSAAPAPVPPATATPPPAAPAPPTKAPKTTAKPKASTTTPSAPSSTNSNPSGTSGGNQHTAKPSKPHHHHAPATPSWFANGDPPPDAFVYDASGAGAKEHPPQAGRVNDGSMKSAWTTANHPGGLNGSGVGLVIDTGQAQPYTDIGIATSTPGYNVSIYSSNDSKGSGSPAANGWKLEGKKSGVAKFQRIHIKGANDIPRYLLVWITKLPPSKSFAGISEISLIL